MGMQVRTLFFLLYLLGMSNCTPMEKDSRLAVIPNEIQYAGAIDPQESSFLSQVPLELVPYLLWRNKSLWQNNSWQLVQTMLAVQQTSRSWHSFLNLRKRKEIVAELYCNGYDFQKCQGATFHELTMLVDGPDSPLDQLRVLIKQPELYVFSGKQVSGCPNTLLALVAKPYMSALSNWLGCTLTQDEITQYVMILIRKVITNINYKNIDGNTPLHLAAANNSVRHVELLLQAKADVGAKNNNNQTPIEYIDKKSLYIQHNPEHFKQIQALLNGTMSPKRNSSAPLPKFIDPKCTKLTPNGAGCS